MFLILLLFIFFLHSLYRNNLDLVFLLNIQDLSIRILSILFILDIIDILHYFINIISLVLILFNLVIYWFFIILRREQICIRFNIFDTDFLIRVLFLIWLWIKFWIYLFDRNFSLFFLLIRFCWRLYLTSINWILRQSHGNKYNEYDSYQCYRIEKRLNPKIPIL